LGGKVSDTVPGVTPPREEIAALRQLVKQAGKMKPAEGERIAGEVAAKYPRESDPLVRLEIVRTLAVLPGAAAEATLREAAKDSDADVRVAVCHALGKRKGAVASEVLRERLAGDTDLDVRLAAAKSLGEIRDPASVAALGTALQDRDPAMQYQAVCSLRKVAPSDLGNDVERWRQYVKDGSVAPAKSLPLAEQFRGLFR
jgi:HEAT repeat protein